MRSWRTTGIASHLCFAKGPIQLQTHGGEIRWRNIFVREIPAERSEPGAEACARRTGFKSIFNGQDFKVGPAPSTIMRSTAQSIRCKDGKGGTALHGRDVRRLRRSLEFSLPPGGNNGLAIRYPGNGDTAYVGMCELQVLDSEHPKYAKLDPRQYHGSAYGMVAAQRGYLRPTGEWNFQEVTVKGSKIKVELNGTVILDTDLSQVTEFMADRSASRQGSPSVTFGFAGHSDPVEFREIYIKRL